MRRNLWPPHTTYKLLYTFSRSQSVNRAAHAYTHCAKTADRQDPVPIFRCTLCQERAKPRVNAVSGRSEPRAAPPRVAMVEIEEEENELSVTELKRMKEAEVITGTCQHTVTCLAAPAPRTGSHA